MQFMESYDSDYAMLLAFIALSMVPVIIFYKFAERQIVSGFTMGAFQG
jgi:raffinose/stachyose/melibiose transport system permease protein